jgi:hypothetical protein
MIGCGDSRAAYLQCWNHHNMSFGNESVMGRHSFYTVMVREEERGWRQLVPPAVTPRAACDALADLIASEKPQDQQSDDDREHVEQALCLLEQDDYELTIGGRRHRLVSANLIVPFENGHPRGPGPKDERFIEFPWNLAEQG